MDIIAHRGFWVKANEQNTVVAFERALAESFGIETDLRDYDGEIVISHDIPSARCLSLTSFLKLCQKNPNIRLALNIKSDGLQTLINKIKIHNPHFYFDMSVPDMLGYEKNNLDFYSRYSNIEATPSLYKECKGIWLDNFIDGNLDVLKMTTFLNDNKNVVLVSPELHKFNKDHYWKELLTYINNNPQHEDKLSICTDYPIDARTYFNAK